MECNKEEAFRAKGIAETKMQNKDFETARKIALKAQQLYKEVENISQMLMVCDVHCCAEKKLFGNEMDWYGILQIEQTADEATIKKQYRKFALLLHPDKNKFPGAEAAFKLIGEAQRVLLDKGRRSAHDMKRRAVVSKPAPVYRSQQRPPYGPNIGVQSNFRSNFPGFNPQQRQTYHSAGQPVFSNGRTTFWTACPFCNVKYQYYVEVMNKSLICQTCSKPFIAYETTVRGAPTAAKSNQSASPQRAEFPKQGFSKVELGVQGNSSAERPKKESYQKKGNDVSSQKVNGKRQRIRGSESSESCDSDSSIETEEDLVVEEDGGLNPGVNHGEPRRRSDRRKQHVSYKEIHSDDEDFVSPLKKAKRSGSSDATEEETRNEVKADSNKANCHSTLRDESAMKQKVGLESPSGKVKDVRNVKDEEKAEEDDSTSDPEFYHYPDPDFNDFEKDRSEECFSAGQIWAAYDTLDAMPRFYVRIRKIFSPEFKLRITWLEPDPDGEDEIEWVSEGLPASCGRFRNGDSENTEDRLMFSHRINWEKGTRRDTYRILPGRGEIWAVFKNWDIKWKTVKNPRQKYEYEFVEILSECTEDTGASVVYLGKVKGFVSLFCRVKKEGKDRFQVPPGELFRFSHMVPSYKLTGHERAGVPKGSFELDPASLPKCIDEITVPEYVDIEDGNSQPNGSCSRSSKEVKPEVVFEATTTVNKADGKGADLEPEVVHVDDEDNHVPPASSVDAIEIPEPEFFNFDAEKSINKFKVGQIWSLYSDEDGLPKYYGRITKVSPEKGFTLHLRWLSACGLPNNAAQWKHKGMPICCGKFKIGRGDSVTYTDANCFSHRLNAEPSPKKNEYTILPRKGEVWALYRNWSAEIKVSDLENCQYDIVEVLEHNDSWIKVACLEQVDGFNSVFKAQWKEGSSVTLSVLRVELLRFSHQIPAFQLTDQRNSDLRGFWELDPAALPVHYFERK